VAGRHHHVDAGRGERGDRRPQCTGVTALDGGTAPGVGEHVGGAVRPAVTQRVAATRERGQHELQAVQVVGRVGQVAVQVHAGDPGGTGGHADAAGAGGGTGGVGAVAVVVDRRGGAVPRVVPGVVAAAEGTGEGRVAAVHATVRAAHHDATPGVPGRPD